MASGNMTPTGKVTNKEQSANITAREQLLTIPGKTLVDLDFVDTYPNYVYINNYGGGTLYFGRSVLPTNLVYDMVIPGNADNLYASPNSFRSAYLYNDGAGEANVKITSFVADFQPSALKGGGGTATAAPTGPAANVSITNFEQPLPAGANMIGHVVVDTMPPVTVTQGPMPAGTNHIGSVAIDQMAPLAEGTSHIGSVDIIGTVSIKDMPPVQVSDQPVATAHQYYEGTIDSAAGAATLYPFPNGAAINMINFLSNDGTTDLYVGFDTIDPSIAANRASGLNGVIHLLPGEALTNFGRKTTGINFFRIAGAGPVRFVGA